MFKQLAQLYGMFTMVFLFDQTLLLLIQLAERLFQERLTIQQQQVSH
jgi:hypothetical protein